MYTKRILFDAALFLFLVFSIVNAASKTSSTADKTQNCKQLSGKIVYLDPVSTPNIIMVKDSKENKKEFAVADSAQITIDGQKAVLEALNTRKGITVYYIKKDKKLVALKIEQVTVKKRYSFQQISNIFKEAE